VLQAKAEVALKLKAKVASLASLASLASPPFVFASPPFAFASLAFERLEQRCYKKAEVAFELA
jgi:hypothetical protein